jgi:hypothetical protein
MRKSNTYLIYLSILLAGFLATLVDAHIRHPRNVSTISAAKDLVKQLGITDLALFTEARYTRHLSQADLHSAFQDHPGAIEHFPSGSLLLPPWRLQQ